MAHQLSSVIQGKRVRKEKKKPTHKQAHTHTFTFARTHTIFQGESFEVSYTLLQINYHGLFCERRIIKEQKTEFLYKEKKPRKIETTPVETKILHGHLRYTDNLQTKILEYKRTTTLLKLSVVYMNQKEHKEKPF